MNDSLALCFTFPFGAFHINCIVVGRSSRSAIVFLPLLLLLELPAVALGVVAVEIESSDLADIAAMRPPQVDLRL